MSKCHVASIFVKNSEKIIYANAKMYESVFRFSHTAISFHSCFLQPCILPDMFLWSVKYCSTKWNQKCWTSQRILHFLTYIWIHVNRTHLFRKTSCFFYQISSFSRSFCSCCCWRFSSRLEATHQFTCHSFDILFHCCTEYKRYTVYHTLFTRCRTM